MANLRTIQFLRNASMYDSLDEAKIGLKGKANGQPDGSPIVGRYTVTSGESTVERAILGIVYNNASGNGVTFFNNIDEIDNVLQNLDYGPIGGTDASVVTKIQQTDGKISGLTSNVGALTLSGYTKGSDSGEVIATDSINNAFSKVEKQIDAVNDVIGALDSNSVANENKIVTDVTQTNGQITATASNITGVKLAGYAEASAGADVATSDTLGEALGKLQKTIHEMDLSVVSGDGEVITAVSEDDGKVSASKTAIKDVKLTSYVKDTTKSGAIEATDDIEDALSKIENQIGKNTVTAKDKSIVVDTTGANTEVGLNIRSGERVLKLDTNATSGGVYTDLDLVKITTDLPTNVKERYELLDSDNVKIGESIDIPKDSHIVSITYITDSGDTHYQNLEYKYIDASGNTQTEYVDISSLVLEAEFASGVTITNHIAHGVVDPTSESFFSVGAAGFKVTGISGFVQTEIEKLDATGGTQTIAGGKHVAVQVVETDGKITAVNVAESDIASATALTKEISDRAGADTALSNRLGDGVTSDNTATAQLAALSGTADDTSASTSIAGAKKYTDEKVADLDANVSGNSTHVTVGVVEENGKITAVTVSESDIASANDLASEIAARKAVDGQNGDTYAANTSATYINNAGSLNDADVKLDAALKAADDAMLTAVAAGNGISVSTKSGKSQTITALAKTNDPVIEVTSNGIGVKDDAVWDCGTF